MIQEFLIYCFVVTVSYLWLVSESNVPHPHELCNEKMFFLMLIYTIKHSLSIGDIVITHLQYKYVVFKF